MDPDLEISSAYSRLILHSGLAPPEVLLQGVELSEDALLEREFIPIVQLIPMFRNFAQLAPDRGWTARLGAQFGIASHGPVGFAAISAPTLGDALDVVAELSPSRHAGMSSNAYATDTHYVLTLADTTGDEQFGIWMMEVLVKIVEELLSTVLGHPVGENVLATFSHAAPADAAALTSLYHASVSFSAPETSLSIPLAWRQLPSPLHDESLYRANVIKCREIIAARDQTSSISERVRNRIGTHFERQLLREQSPSAPPTLETVADEMHVSPRTLIRQLQKEEQSYRDLLEALRKEYAEQLLGDARLTVAEVGELLGYREAANFGRAFRRWYGCSPAAWRRR